MKEHKESCWSLENPLAFLDFLKQNGDEKVEIGWLVGDNMTFCLKFFMLGNVPHKLTKSTLLRYFYPKIISLG